MAAVVGELRFIPEIRSAHFERSHRPRHRLVLFAGEYADLDPRSTHGRAHRVRLWTAWTWALRGRQRVVELPEPLWLRALPFTYSIGLAFRLTDLLRRHRTVIVTYAMENNEPERLFRPLSAPARRAVAAVIRWLGGIVYDRIAFASPAAAECYRKAGVLPPAVSTRDFLELMPRCDCAGEPEPGTVVFLGALEARKGLPDLLEAWATLPAASNGWVLRIAGTGPYHAQVLRAAAADPSIDYVGGVGRTEVHALLRHAAVLVLPSRREGRWCEQIGLPINEGLAHDCLIVATPDTGLAPWLREHGQVVLPDDFTTRQLATALADALRSTSRGADPVADQLPPVDTRILAEDWMYSPDRRPEGPEDVEPALRSPAAVQPAELYRDRA